MNPRFGIFGHFPLPPEAMADLTRRLEVSVSVAIVDQYERRHALLPMIWIYMQDEHNWFAHPVVGT
jgi:hypothetical protein